MGEERLVGLEHVTCNKNISVDIDKVINKLSKKKRTINVFL